jgi:hypothetical protein
MPRSKPSFSGYNRQWALKPAGGGIHTFVNRNSAKLMGVSGGLGADSAPVILWPSNGGHNQQRSQTFR